MLDLIPLARPRWEMTDRDGQACLPVALETVVETVEKLGDLRMADRMFPVDPTLSQSPPCSYKSIAAPIPGRPVFDDRSSLPRYPRAAGRHR